MEGADVLDWVACVNTNQLVLSYLRDVKSTLEVSSHVKVGGLVMS